MSDTCLNCGGSFGTTQRLCQCLSYPYQRRASYWATASPDKIKSLEEELESVKAANKHLEEQNAVLVEALKTIIDCSHHDWIRKAEEAALIAKKALAKVGVK